MRRHIQHQSAVLKHVCLRLRAHIVALIATELRLHARDKLQRQKRLCDIIVRAERQTSDLIDLFALRRQHDDRIIVFFANFPAERETVHIRKHHVQDRQIELLLLNTLQRIRRTIVFVHMEIFIPKI